MADVRGFNLCTKENPWKPEMGVPVMHEDAKEVGDQEAGYPGGDIVTMRCPNCGHEWRKELAQ